MSGTTVRNLAERSTPVTSSSSVPVPTPLPAAVLTNAIHANKAAVEMEEDQGDGLSTDSEADKEALDAEIMNNPDDQRPRRGVRRITKKEKKDKKAKAGAKHHRAA